MTTQRGTRWLAGLVVWILLGVWPVLAQPDAPPDVTVALPLAYGDSASGRIDDRTPRLLYTFEGLRGDLIVIDLQVTAGDLLPMLTLVDADGGLVALRDFAPGGVIRLASLRLPSSGRFFVVVGRFGYGLGETGGDFSLSLQRRGPSSASGSALRPGDTVINAITDAEPQVYYTVQATAGEMLTVEMQRMSGDLDARLLLVDSAGVIVAENDDVADLANPGALDARISGFTPPTAGVYVIIATRFGEAAGPSSGNFVLTVRAGEAVGAGRTALAPLPVQVGSVVTGAITAERFEVWYGLDGTAGQTVTVRAARTGGDLDTLVQVLDATQAVIGENDDSDDTQNSRLTVTLPADGRYLVLVTRYQRAGGVTTGDYTLTVTGGE